VAATAAGFPRLMTVNPPGAHLRRILVSLAAGNEPSQAETGTSPKSSAMANLDLTTSQP